MFGRARREVGKNCSGQLQQFLISGRIVNRRLNAFFEKKPPKRPQVIEQASAYLDVLFEFFQFVKDQAERITAPWNLGIGQNICLGGLNCLRERLRQQRQVFPRALDIFERSLEGVIHSRT